MPAVLRALSSRITPSCTQVLGIQPRSAVSKAGNLIPLFSLQQSLLILEWLAIITKRKCLLTPNKSVFCHEQTKPNSCQLKGQCIVVT